MAPPSSAPWTSRGDPGAAATASSYSENRGSWKGGTGPVQTIRVRRGRRLYIGTSFMKGAGSEIARTASESSRMHRISAEERRGLTGTKTAAVFKTAKEASRKAWQLR